MEKYINSFSIALFALSFFLFGWMSHKGYDAPQKKKIVKTRLDNIKASKELKVVFLNSPSIYYIGTDGPQGFEYDLLKSYADSIGVELKITTVNTIEEVIKYIDNDSIDVISASLAKTPLRKRKFNFGPSYFEVQQQVICNRKMKYPKKIPRSLEDLGGINLVVGEGTSYAERILRLQARGYDINATFTSDFSTEELLSKVSSSEIECTIVDSNIYSLNIRYYTEMTLAFTLSEREQLAWVIAKDAESLKSDMYTWFNRFNQDGSMAQLKDHYYSYVGNFDYYNTKVFYKRIKKRLPRYEALFKKAGSQYNIPWKLLAAISYQESYWNANAVSFTGVKGLMMLTNATAKLQGVTDRTNPEQSVFGGAKHIRYMMKIVPKEIEGENRLKVALAAYNVGMGHIYDARKLALSMGLNPNIWSDLKQVLPLLSQKKYYQNLKYGYARGSEPVKYVDSIYDFRDILENYFAPATTPKEAL
jgi:membrane-bound lytic murein transglycosylase F